MAEHHASVEADEQIDLDGDNDIEDMMDDEDAGEDDGYRRLRDDYNEEEQHDEYHEDDHESEGDGNDKDSSSDELTNASSPLKDTTARTIDEQERLKHAELLALPPHGSEVFVGGLPRDVTEEDLRDLCESFGEIYEVTMVLFLELHLLLLREWCDISNGSGTASKR